MTPKDLPEPEKMTPVAEVHCGRLRWHIPHQSHVVPDKYMNNETHLLYDQAAIDAAVDAVRERCALEAEHWQSISTTPGHACGQYIAAAIRKAT